MKKILLSYLCPNNDLLRKLIRYMKLTFFVVLLGCLQVSAHVSGQKMFTLDMTHVSVDKVLNKIQKESAYRFFYNEKYLKHLNPVSVKVNGASLSEIMSMLLDGSLSYKIIDSNLVVISPKGSLAVQHKIDGVVTDENGNPLVGVTLKVKENNQGTVTDAKGEFTLVVPDNATLVVSYIGYQTQEIAVGSQTTFHIKMQASASGLTEVVVVGYGTQKKSTLTGSIATVSGKELQETPTSNITNALVGRLPGLIAVNPSGQPGTGSNLYIRGFSTLNDNTALVVVDGVVRQDGFGNLDPNEIESISILKDAAAASVYGARAANGVFLITTKRGKTGKPTITYSGIVGYQQPTNYPKLMSAYQFASVRNKALINQGYSPTNPTQAGLFYSDSALNVFRQRGDDNVWYDATFKKRSLQSSHDLSISGGSEAIKYFASFGTTSQDGMYDNINFKRYNFRSNVDAQVNKNLLIKLGLEGRQEVTNTPGFGAPSIFAAVLRQNPTFRAFNDDGSYFNTTGENPVAMFQATGYNKKTWDVFQGSLSFVQDLPFITDGLSLTGMMSIYKDRMFNKIFFTPYTMYGKDADGNITSTKTVGGQTSLNEIYQEDDQQTYNIALNYEHQFGKHNVKGLLVYEEYSSKGNLFSAYRQEFLSNIKDELFASGTTNQSLGGYGIITDARRSVIGRVNYAFNDKYLLEGVFRYDGSFRFPPGKRWGFFPAVSAGWVISQESFFKNSASLAFIDNLKIRAGYGVVGNDRVDINGDGIPDAFQFLDNYSINSGSGPVINGSAVPYISYGVYPNPNITWERQYGTNVGLDASLFHEKLNWTFDYFSRITKDILWSRNRSVPATFGRSLPSENYAQMKSSGWETSLGYRDQVGELSYNVSFNISQAKNKVTVIDDPANALDYQRQLDKPYQFRAGYEVEGIFRTQEEADNWYGGKQFGQPSKAGDLKYADVNGNGEIDIQDQKVISDFNNTPRVVYGFSGGLAWKGIDFNFLFQGAGQRNLMLSGTGRVMYANGGASGNFAYLADSWTPDNPGAKYPLAWVDSRSVNDRSSTFWLQNARYLRLKSVDIGYTFDSHWLSDKGINKLRIYVSGLNLLTWSPLKEFGLDPEASAGNGLYYPQQRNFNFGLNITL